MKMSGHGIIPSSNLFLLNSYQDWLDLGSNLTMMRTIIGIPRKNASQWTISWEINFLMTKSLYTEVMKLEKWQNVYLAPI